MLMLVGALAGCAHNNPRDPLEPFNRTVYAFNDTVDQMILKPVATGYRAVFPQFVRTGVRNFFSNLDDITGIVNGLLQLKIPQAVSDLGRFLLNSTVGIAGLFDVATHLGLEKHNEDFGQTLGYWGIGSGPYLVLPFLGPSSFRDGIGRVVDVYTDVVWHIDDVSVRNVLVATRVVSNREQLLDSEKVLDTAALDRYSFIRDAYLQRRRSLVYDGNPPPEEEEEEELKNDKPQSAIEPGVFSILTDQYGNVVAAGASGAASTSFFDTARTEPAPAGAPAPTPKPSSATPTSDASRAQNGRIDGTPATGSGAGGQPPLVRVWLPGSSSR